jgi:hypothetical protein
MHYIVQQPDGTWTPKRVIINKNYCEKVAHQRVENEGDDRQANDHVSYGQRDKKEMNCPENKNKDLRCDAIIGM